MSDRKIRHLIKLTTYLVYFSPITVQKVDIYDCENRYSQNKCKITKNPKIKKIVSMLKVYRPLPKAIGLLNLKVN